MKRIHFVVLLSLVLTSGCIVISPTTNIPLMEKKNDLKIEGGVSCYPGVTGAISYSPINKMAVQLAGYGLHDNYYAHGALGYYTKLDSSFVFENYYGFGSGFSKGVDNSLNSVSLSYKEYFSQFNFGVHPWSGVTLGVGLKAGLLNTQIDHQSSVQCFIIQPQAIARIGERKLKFEVKLNGNWINNLYLKNSGIRDRLPYIYSNIGLGFIYEL